jgi:hypothetical protein
MTTEHLKAALKSYAEMQYILNAAEKRANAEYDISIMK